MHEYDGISPFYTFKKLLSTLARNTKQVISGRIPNTENLVYRHGFGYWIGFSFYNTFVYTYA